MGFFSDLRKLNKLGAQEYAKVDVAAQFAHTRAELGALSASLAAAPAPGTGQHATATVIAADPTGTVIDISPVFALELTVMPGSGLPWPARTTVAVAPQHLHRIAPGSQLEVRWDAHRPGAVGIDW